MLTWKKHIMFQIQYIVSPLCPASLKHLIFYKVPLIGQLAQCIVIGQTPQAASVMQRLFP